MMTGPLKYFLLGTGLFLSICCSAQPRASIGFYNVENLYDTVPSLFYDDSGWLPSGSRKWDGHRYGGKLRNLARVIDDMKLDVLGICEVESEMAVRDLVSTLETDYNYIHRNSSDPRGMDVALLYKGDKFFPDEVDMVNIGFSREIMYVRGLFGEERLDVIVCHLPSNYNSMDRRRRVLGNLLDFADSLTANDPCARVVLMGDFNADPQDRIMRKTMRARYGKGGYSPLFTPFPGKKAGRGSYAYSGRWRQYDLIFLSTAFMYEPRLRYVDHGNFIRPYMLTADHTRRHGFPLRTFDGNRWCQGYSDHLPVYIVLDIL